MKAERRAELLENGTYRQYTGKRKSAALLENGAPDPNTGELFSLLPTTQEVTREQTAFFGMTEEDIKDCERIRRAKKEQRERLEEHVRYLIERKDLDLFFLTFTFNDDALELKKDTRKQAIRRLLGKWTDDYIMNIDYGAEKGREHYHAVISLKKGEYETKEGENGHIYPAFLDGYKMGFFACEKVEKDGKSAERLSRYVTKLTMHSVKVDQQYVSTKKGSAFQRWKKVQAMQMETAVKTEAVYEILDQVKHPAVKEWKERMKRESLYDPLTLPMTAPKPKRKRAKRTRSAKPSKDATGSSRPLTS